MKLYKLEAALEEALERRVWLKSGGYLVIEADGGPDCRRR